jgi:hypothetical protein
MLLVSQTYWFTKNPDCRSVLAEVVGTAQLVAMMVNYHRPYKLAV